MWKENVSRLYFIEGLKMGILFCADYAHMDTKVLDFKNEIPIFI